MAYERLNEHSRNFLSKGYLVEGQTPEERIREIAENAEKILGIEGFADKFEKYMSLGYYSLATPVWTNFGNDRGLPISCFGCDIEDNMESILMTQAEVGMMSKLGGGTSGYFGRLRGRGAPIKNNGNSSGAVHFMQLFETITDVVSQGSQRRGQFAPYLDVEHPDIEEFLKIGTEGNAIQKMTTGVCIGDEWMESMIGGDEDKRKIWGEILKRRSEVGYPYIFFRDNVNKAKPSVYKEKGMDITHGNLCNEICLPDSEDESFVCCLSSINLLHIQEIIRTDAIETMVFFLDSVMTEFISKIREMKGSKRIMMQKALNFANNHRAIGIGVIGYHSYLQSIGVPFSNADLVNKIIFMEIRERSKKASKVLGKMLGYAPVFEGCEDKYRNSTTMAIAPTTSSAFILGQVSQSIEPLMSNYFIKDTAKAKITIKNKLLEQLLEEKGMNTDEIWSSIINNDGSVMHLEGLSQMEKDVFRTFGEIDQADIIKQAAGRQYYIDQGQSLNVCIGSDYSPRDISKLHIGAWEQGIKGLYYQHSFNKAQNLGRKFKCSGCEA